MKSYLLVGDGVCRPTRALRLTAEDSGLPTRSDQHLSAKTDQAGGAALQAGMPVFRAAHRPRWLSQPANVVVAEQPDPRKSAAPGTAAVLAIPAQRLNLPPDATGSDVVAALATALAAPDPRRFVPAEAVQDMVRGRQPETGNPQ